LAGVRAVVFHSAQQAGLEERTKEELAEATIEVCREAFAVARNGTRRDVAIKLSVGDAPDRLEISVEYPGDILKGLNGSPIAAACTAKNGASALSGVDQVRCETAGGLSRVTLIRRCNNPK
jgi:hypothetical protein